MAMKLDHEDLNRLIEKISTSDIQEFSLEGEDFNCLLYTSPSPRDRTRSRMPSSA